MKRLRAAMRWWLMKRGISYRYYGEDEVVLFSTRRLSLDEVAKLREEWAQRWKGAH